MSQYNKLHCIECIRFVYSPTIYEEGYVYSYFTILALKEHHVSTKHGRGVSELSSSN